MNGISNKPLYLVVTILTIIIVFFVLTGRKLPLVSGYRGATIALVAIGFLMCTFGSIGYIITKNPIGLSSIIGMVLGTVALIIGILSIMGKKIPFIGGEREAFVAVAVIILFKFIIARAYALFVR